MWQELLKQLQQGDIKALARSISFIENEYAGYENLCNRFLLLIQKLLA
jgi:LAO/AO transport system kinase